MTPDPNPSRQPPTDPDAVDVFAPAPELDGLDTHSLRAPTTSTPQPRPAGDPPRFGTYRPVREIGTGGMGVVYEAEDEYLHRRVALKVLRGDLPLEQRARDRFLREARAMAAVHDDHIVAIYQVGEAGGRPYMAMQLLAGETLETRMQREGRMAPPEAARIGREIALGLAAAHAKGLVHRDVKPANVWLESPAGRVKILDFGLARGDGSPTLTHTGFIIGTPAYMSPEQARGEGLDGRSDLFSLGVILYQMTTGDRPFEGPNALTVVRNLEYHHPARVNVKRPEVPAAFSNLIMELLAKCAKDRPERAAIVADRLARPEVIRPSRLPVAPPGPVSVAPEAPTAVPVVRARSGIEPHARSTPPHASPSLLRILFLVALAVVGFGVFWYYQIANFGRLAIEAAPEAVVEVRQAGEVKQTSLVERQFELRPGSYDLVLVSPLTGFHLTRTQVDIRRDSTEVVRVIKNDQ